MRHFFRSLCLLLLTASAAHAQSSVPVTLMKATGQTLTTTGSIYAHSQLVDNHCYGTLYAVNNSGTLPTLDGKIQHCEGTNTALCKDLLTFDQCTTGTCYKRTFIDSTNTAPSGWYRAVTTLAGTDPNYDVTVKFFCGRAH